MSIQEYQNAVDKWVKTYGVRYFSELTNLGILMEEVGEVARIMTRTYGEQSFKEEDANPALADELADVLFVTVCIANQTGIDLTAAIEKNLQKKSTRDKERHWNNPKLTGKTGVKPPDNKP
ncbi:MAG: nucleotide pyrophosphohydrolase [Deltaproteobacteria bacterium]|nr:nucleotide pyrophosphohydrolase [Deltaproteobacteria bacterium]